MSENWLPLFLASLCLSGCATPQGNSSCEQGSAVFLRAQSQRSALTLRVQGSGSLKTLQLPSAEANFMNGAETRTICLSEEGVAAFNMPRVGTDQFFYGILAMELMLQAEKLSNANKSLQPITPAIDPSCDRQARKDFESEICTRFPFMDKCVANSSNTELTIGSEEQDRAAYALQVEGGQRVAQLYKQCLQIKVKG